MIAIMGESGAGKTSLLNVLAQRAHGTIDGTMMVNGREPDKEFKLAGYVTCDLISMENVLLLRAWMNFIYTCDENIVIITYMDMTDR